MSPSITKPRMKCVRPDSGEGNLFSIATDNCKAVPQQEFSSSKVPSVQDATSDVIVLESKVPNVSIGDDARRKISMEGVVGDT